MLGLNTTAFLLYELSAASDRSTSPRW